MKKTTSIIYILMSLISFILICINPQITFALLSIAFIYLLCITGKMRLFERNDYLLSFALWVIIAPFLFISMPLNRVMCISLFLMITTLFSSKIICDFYKQDNDILPYLSGVVQSVNINTVIPGTEEFSKHTPGSL